MKKIVKFLIFSLTVIALLTVNMPISVAQNTDFEVNSVNCYKHTDCNKDCLLQDLGFEYPTEFVDEIIDIVISNGVISFEELHTGGFTFHVTINGGNLNLEKANEFVESLISPTDSFDLFFSEYLVRSPIHHCCHHITPVWGNPTYIHSRNAAGICIQVIRVQFLFCTNCGFLHARKETSLPGCGSRC